MEPISRRLFLAGSAALGVGACTGGRETASTAAPAPSSAAVEVSESTAPDPVLETVPSTVPPVSLDAVQLPGHPFTLGVASGDPTPTSVVLWTRLAPDPLNGGGMPADDITVTWEVAADESFAALIASGTTIAEARFGHSVHVTAPLSTGGNAVHYRFRVGQHVSPTGTTRGAPAADAAVDSCTFASASCQHYEHGYYTAHRDIAALRPDFVVWLGDYVYEGAQGTIGGDGGNVRSHGTAEATTLVEYRNRYALYKSDPDLQAAHAACPWIVTWDDHEVENNYAGDTPASAMDRAAFATRRHEAYQAWWEHQPVALPPPAADQPYPIHRSFRWGSLLTLAVLDGRQYRSVQTCGGQTLDLDPACPETFDPQRTMLGEVQEAWLFEVLAGSTTTWNVIAQQTVFGDVTLGDAVLNYDQWDGYPVARNRIVDRLATDAIGNVVVLTGDIHFAGTGVIRAGGRGTGTPVGTEFVTTSISSGGRVDPAVTAVVRAIPDIVDVELEHRGYIAHTVASPAWDARYRMVRTVKQPDSDLFEHAHYRVDAGTNVVRVVERVNGG